MRRHVGMRRRDALFAIFTFSLPTAVGVDTDSASFAALAAAAVASVTSAATGLAAASTTAATTAGTSAKPPAYATGRGSMRV